MDCFYDLFIVLCPIKQSSGKTFFRCGFHIFKLISDESKIYLTRERGTFDIIGWTKNSSVIQYTHNPQTKVSSTVLGGIWINLQRHSAFHVSVIQFFNASLQPFEGIQRNLFSPPRKSINFFASEKNRKRINYTLYYFYSWEISFTLTKEKNVVHNRHFYGLFCASR